MDAWRSGAAGTARQGFLSSPFGKGLRTADLTGQP